MTNEHHDAEEIRKSGFDGSEKPLHSLSFSRADRGQRYPQQNPQSADALGDPLTIREVARLIGCSPWTVRHSYLPKGLPHMRSGPLGKLIFYRAQVVRWILQRQQKGGM
jgi:hypothetical protein